MESGVAGCLCAVGMAGFKRITLMGWVGGAEGLGEQDAFGRARPELVIVRSSFEFCGLGQRSWRRSDAMKGWPAVAIGDSAPSDQQHWPPPRNRNNRHGQQATQELVSRAAHAHLSIGT
jgi:hypothetical protein